MDIAEKIERTRRLAASESKSGPEQICTAQTVGIIGGVGYYLITAIDTTTNLLTVKQLITSGSHVWTVTGIEMTCYPSPCYSIDLSTSDGYVMSHYIVGRPIPAIKVNGILTALPSTPYAFKEYEEES